VPSTQAQRCRNETARRSSKKAPEQPTWMHEVIPVEASALHRWRSERAQNDARPGKAAASPARRSGPRSLAPRGEGRVWVA
jgi:hypothetical protein